VRLTLRPQESVLHPNPYVEDEDPPLIVTTFRVMYKGSGKKQELESSKLTYSGKRNDPTIMKLLVLFVLIALPFLIVGGLQTYRYKDLPKGPDKAAKGQLQKPYSPVQLQQFADNKRDFIIGIGLVAFGAIFAGAAYLLYKRRLNVLIGGGGKVMRIRVKDAQEQDKVLMMIGASQTAAKAMAPAAKAAPAAPRAGPKR
jgi:hypothetical protein